MEIVGWILIIIGLLISVGLHEMGHLIPAKIFGVKVSQYMIGFGPTMWSKVKGETEYGIKWILLGGYIRMIGMVPPKRALKKYAKDKVAVTSDGQQVDLPVADGDSSEHWWDRMADDIRDSADQEVGQTDEKRVFYSLSAPKKITVMMGGPIMNLVLCAVFLGIAICAIGIPTVTTTIASVQPCSEYDSSGECTTRPDTTPAMAAGLHDGDTVVSYNGKSVSTPQELQSAVKATPGKTVPIVVDRGGQNIEMTITPESVTSGSNTVGKIGVQFDTDMQRESITALPGEVWNGFTGMIGAIVHLPQITYDTAASLITGEKRDPNGAVGIVGVGRLAGDVVSSNAPGADFSEKAVMVLSLVASLNMALFVFNLIPLIPLDGGRVAGAVWEGARRKFAAWRGRPDPGFADLARFEPVAYGVFTLLFVMGAIIILADLFNPVSLS